MLPQTHGWHAGMTSQNLHDENEHALATGHRLLRFVHKRSLRGVLAGPAESAIGNRHKCSLLFGVRLKRTQ